MNKSKIDNQKLSLLTDVEVADILNMSVQTLRNWRNQGRGLPYIRLGSSIRYQVADVLDELENRKIYPSED